MEAIRDAIEGISSGFDWEASVMGHDYWGDVITALRNELEEE